MTLLALAALFALLVYVARRAWRKPTTEQASVEDEKRYALQCWLNDDDFTRTAYRLGVIDAMGRDILLGRLGKLRHGELDAVMYRLLGPRECRIAAAAVMEEHSENPGKADRKDAMRRLTDFVIRMRDGEKAALEALRKKGKA